MKITVNLENWPQNFCSADRGQLTPIEQYQNVLFKREGEFERRMWNYVNHNMPELLNETTLIWVTGNYNFLRFNQ